MARSNSDRGKRAGGGGIVAARKSRRSSAFLRACVPHASYSAPARAPTRERAFVNRFARACP